MFQKGDIVSVKAFPNQILTRRVVGIMDGQKILVCNNDEYETALSEQRDPVAIGFRIEDVIMNENEQAD
jgi:hypothetical protein